MNALLKPADPEAELHEAIERRETAHNHVEQAKADLARAHSTRDRQRNVLTNATAAEQSSSIEDAPLTAQARRDAEDRLAAAERQVTAATEALSQRRVALTAAEDAVTKATANVVKSEIEAAHKELAIIDAKRRALRDNLLGAYLAYPDALPDHVWHEIDRGQTLHCRGMNIGLPPLRHDFHPELVFPDVRLHRSRVEAAAEAWRERLQQGRAR